MASINRKFDVNVITHRHQKIHKIYIQSQIIHTHTLSYMFQQQITAISETLIQRNTQLIHPMYTYKVKNK